MFAEYAIDTDEIVRFCICDFHHTPSQAPYMGMIFDTCTGGYFMIAVDPRIGTKIVLYQIYVRSVDLSNRLVSEHRGGARAVPGGARGGAAHLPSDRLKRSEGREQR